MSVAYNRATSKQDDGILDKSAISQLFTFGGRMLVNHAPLRACHIGYENWIDLDKPSQREDELP